MKWPWQRRETRAASGYTNVILAALYRAASGGSSQPENLACVQAAARLWGRVLSLAVVEPQDTATAAVHPAFLYSVGERLALDGRAIALLSVAGDGLRFHMPSRWEIEGTSLNREHWTYRMWFDSNGTETSLDVGSESTLDITLGSEHLGGSAGLRGVHAGSETGRLAAGLESALADLSESPRGCLLPVPGGVFEDDTPEYSALSETIAKLRGGVAVVESSASGHDRLETVGRKTEAPIKLGPSAEAPVVKLRKDAEQSMLAMLGVPSELLGISNNALSADRRSLLRGFQASVMEPVSRIVAAELTRLLERPVGLRFGTNTPADIVSRSRAYRSLREAGADHVSSAAAAGLSDLRPEPEPPQRSTE